MSVDRVESLLESWREEKQSAFLYRVMAESERGSPREKLFLSLATAAERQSETWAASLVRQGATVPAHYAPVVRARVVATLIRRMGPRSIRPILAAMKVRGISVYSGPIRFHETPEAGQAEVRHDSAGQGGNLRAAVFGASDGLVSNASLILGMAGAAVEPRALVTAGVAGLLAGAFSMATGEYISVRSQRELFEYQIGLEREELKAYPEEEAMELALIYEAKGVPEVEAKSLADRIIQDPDRALDALAREELGLNPGDLGSPWGAAISSFIAFASGAALPLIPVLLGAGVQWALILAAFTLFGMGVVTSLFTGRGALSSGARMLGLGAAAGGVTYVIGCALGVSLG